VKPADAVRIDFEARYAPDRTILDGPLCQEAKDWLIVIGEKDVLPAVEMGVRFMSVGETALVWSHSKFAHGPGQRKHGDFELPSNANVLFQITVRAILKPSATTADEIAIALSKKNIGNDIFANEWNPYGIARAKQQYKRAGELMEHLLQTGTWKDDEEDDRFLQQKAREIMLDSFNNLAALHLRNKDYKLAKEAAVKVLERDPDNFKALIRAAKAALLDPASEFEEVEAALAAAASRSEHASDLDLQKLKEEFVRRKRAYKKKSKAMFANKKKFESSIQTISEEAKEEADESTNDDGGEKLVDGQCTIEGAQSFSEAEGSVAAAPEPTSTSQIGNSMDWRKWDWKNKVLPYAFQLLMTCVMYWYYTVLKQQQDEKMAAALQEAQFTQQILNDNEFEFLLSDPTSTQNEL
jgi:tetratricopeptide (TPR) repeat protein